jgi:transcriptional regulator with XRE-family HTH domain
MTSAQRHGALLEIPFITKRLQNARCCVKWDAWSKKMSYLSAALKRASEERQMSQADVARLSGLSRSHVSRLFSGDQSNLSDEHFIAMLRAFGDTQAQARLVAARCMDARVGPGSEQVEITVKAGPAQAVKVPEILLAHESERAFEWLRSQCPVNPELEKHLVGYARLTGMK